MTVLSNNLFNTPYPQLPVGGRELLSPMVLGSIWGSCISSEQTLGRFPRGASVSQSWRNYCEGGAHRKGLAHSRCSQNDSCFVCMARLLNLKYILETEEREELEVLIGTMVVARG